MLALSCAQAVDCWPEGRAGQCLVNKTQQSGPSWSPSHRKGLGRDRGWDLILEVRLAGPRTLDRSAPSQRLFALGL